MSNKFKYLVIKIPTFSFFDNMINRKNLDPNKIKINKKSYKNILVYYTGYETFKDLRYVNINCEILYT